MSEETAIGGFFVINDGSQFDDIVHHVKFYVAPVYLLRSNKSNLSPGSYHGVVLPWENPKKHTQPRQWRP